MGDGPPFDLWAPPKKKKKKKGGKGEKRGKLTKMLLFFKTLGIFVDKKGSKEGKMGEKWGKFTKFLSS